MVREVSEKHYECGICGQRFRGGEIGEDDESIEKARLDALGCEAKGVPAAIPYGTIFEGNERRGGENMLFVVCGAKDYLFEKVDRGEGEILNFEGRHVRNHLLESFVRHEATDGKYYSFQDEQEFFDGGGKSVMKTLTKLTDEESEAVLRNNPNVLRFCLKMFYPNFAEYANID